MDITPYKVPDHVFYENEDRGSDPLARELVGEYRGLLVDAPQRINMAERSSLPGAVYHLGEIRELAAVPFDQFGVITAMDLGANRLHAIAGSALRRDEDLMEAPPMDSAEFPDGDMSTTYPLDFRGVLGLPWQPGRFLLTALQRETVSNRAQVDLVTFDNPDNSFAATPPVVGDTELFPSPGSGAISYQPHPNSPIVPDGFGIALAPQRIVELKQDNPWPLHGTFRLPAPFGPTLSIHLLLTGADDGSLDLITLRVPPTGYFNVDLGRLTLLRAPQTYFLSAFAGPYLAPPVPTALLGWH